jgi:hypothetical protein
MRGARPHSGPGASSPWRCEGTARKSSARGGAEPPDPAGDGGLGRLIDRSPIPAWRTHLLPGDRRRPGRLPRLLPYSSLVGTRWWCRHWHLHRSREYQQATIEELEPAISGPTRLSGGLWSALMATGDGSSIAALSTGPMGFRVEQVAQGGLSPWYSSAALRSPTDSALILALEPGVHNAARRVVERHASPPRAGPPKAGRRRRPPPPQSVVPGRLVLPEASCPLPRSVVWVGKQPLSLAQGRAVLVYVRLLWYFLGRGRP